MKKLEPFGEGVPKPVFKIQLHTAPKRHSMLGADKSHLKLFCKSFNAVGFSLADKYIRQSYLVILRHWGISLKTVLPERYSMSLCLSILNR